MAVELCKIGVTTVQRMSVLLNDHLLCSTKYLAIAKLAGFCVLPLLALALLLWQGAYHGWHIITLCMLYIQLSTASDLKANVVQAHVIALTLLA